VHKQLRATPKTLFSEGKKRDGGYATLKQVCCKARGPVKNDARVSSVSFFVDFSKFPVDSLRLFCSFACHIPVLTHVHT
jgi:hypothetical protein